MPFLYSILLVAICGVRCCCCGEVLLPLCGVVVVVVVVLIVVEGLGCFFSIVGLVDFNVRLIVGPNYCF